MSKGSKYKLNNYTPEVKTKIIFKMDTISVPRRHSSCSMSNATTPPISPTLIINRASPIPDGNTICRAFIDGSKVSLI